MTGRDAKSLESHETDPLTAFEGDVPTAPDRASRLRRQVRHNLPAAGLFVAVIVLWEVLTRALNVQSFLLPKPTEIADRFVGNSGEIWSAGWETLKEAVGGFVVGATLGVLVALATVRWVAVRDGLMPFAIAANAVPIIALAPITNAMFSLTSPVSKAAVVASAQQVG